VPPTVTLHERPGAQKLTGIAVRAAGIEGASVAPVTQRQRSEVILTGRVLHVRRTLPNYLRSSSHAYYTSRL